MAGNRREYNIKAAQFVNEGLQFTAQSVIIDNPNSYYIWFPLIRRWVAPFTTGVVIRYGAYPSVASFQTDILPPGLNPPFNVVDLGAKVIFIEDLISESGGVVTTAETSPVSSIYNPNHIQIALIDFAVIQPLASWLILFDATPYDRRLWHLQISFDAVVSQLQLWVRSFYGLSNINTANNTPQNIPLYGYTLPAIPVPNQDNTVKVKNMGQNPITNVRGSITYELV